MPCKLGGISPPRARSRKGTAPTPNTVTWFGARLRVHKTHLEITNRAWRLIRLASATSPVIRWKGPPPAAR